MGKVIRTIDDLISEINSEGLPIGAKWLIAQLQGIKAHTEQGEADKQCCLNAKKFLESDICTWNHCPTCGNRIRAHVRPVSQRGLPDTTGSDKEAGNE